jgi:hypothetical protein
VGGIPAGAHPGPSLLREGVHVKCLLCCGCLYAKTPETGSSLLDLDPRLMNVSLHSCMVTCVCT